ncbi:MAG: hexose kinase [bacterium]|nr:hexose kinase [bacterium]
MIVSLTANTTLDLTLFVPSFGMNRTIRATRTVQSMGGKPTDASWILGEMGIPSMALGFAAGAIGRKVESLLRQKGVSHDFIEVGGETRINTVIVSEDGSGQSVITTSTLEIDPAHLDALRAKFESALDTATAVVLGGTLPRAISPAFYTEFIGIAKGRGIPVIFDADEPNLSAGLVAQPDYIKPNHHELGALMGREINTLQAAYEAGRKIIHDYGTCPIITLAGEGGLAVLPDRAYHIPPLVIEVVSAAGAGDGVLAGITYACANDLPIEEGLRLGFACAAAVCLQPGTADCRKADVERFLPIIELVPYR